MWGHELTDCTLHSEDGDLNNNFEICAVQRTLIVYAHVRTKWTTGPDCSSYIKQLECFGSTDARQDDFHSKIILKT